MERVGRPLAEPRPASKAPRAIEEILRDESAASGRKLSIEDGRRALALVRDRAPDWGVDPGKIGMMGFSAGAFLTIDVALSEGGEELAFAAPIYVGGAAGRPIPAGAPPLFTCIAQDDRLLFRVVEGLYRDWSEADPAGRDSHLPPRRPRVRHGQAGRAGGRLDGPLRRLAEGPRLLKAIKLRPA